MGKDEAFIDDFRTSDDQRNPGHSIRLPDSEGFNWGNISTALRWNYIWGKQLFSNATLYYGTYRFRNLEESERIVSLDRFTEELRGENDFAKYNSEYVYYSGIKDLSAKLDFSYIPSTNQYVRFGLKGTKYMFEPGVQIAEYEWEDVTSSREYGGADTVYAASLTAYLENDFSIGERFRSNIGLSSTAFIVDGKTYYSIEPRVSARFKITDRLVYKASYAKMSQPVHLLTNSMIGLPTDIWVPSTRELSPELSWQIASGIIFKYDASWEFSFEVFYKDMQNLVEYAEGAELLMNDKNWVSKIESGEGEAYGAEFYIQKTRGRWTGSLGYAWSKNFRTFENISFGEPFPYKYDRRHDISVVCNYQLKDNITMGGVWVYGSGIRTTVLDQSYLNPFAAIGGKPVNENSFYSNDLVRNFEQRNGYQLPAYHRLDIGFNFEKEKKHFIRTCSFGAYNAYSRRNAFYIYTSQGKWTDTSEWEKRVYQVTIFPLIPYIRYSIDF